MPKSRRRDFWRQVALTDNAAMERFFQHLENESIGWRLLLRLLLPTSRLCPGHLECLTRAADIGYCHGLDTKGAYLGT